MDEKSYNAKKDLAQFLPMLFVGVVFGVIWVALCKPGEGLPMFLLPYFGAALFLSWILGIFLIPNHS